jgi:hypothetical protein
MGVQVGDGEIAGIHRCRGLTNSSAIYGEGIDNLREGDGVEFDLSEDGPRGPRAANVRRTTT